MSTFQHHFEILPEVQKKLYSQLKPVTKLGFVLHGGTAVALRLGHRNSVDFDFFKVDTFDENELRAALPFLERATVLKNEPNTFEASVPSTTAKGDNVKVSFFGNVPAIQRGYVRQPDYTADGILRVASLDDLMADKLVAVYGRISEKDYRDIAEMIRNGVSLERGMACAKARFGNTFQPRETLATLTYFEGGDLKKLSREDRRVLIEAAGRVRNLPVVPLLTEEGIQEPQASKDTTKVDQRSAVRKRHDNDLGRCPPRK